MGDASSNSRTSGLPGALGGLLGPLLGDVGHQVDQASHNLNPALLNRATTAASIGERVAAVSTPIGSDGSVTLDLPRAGTWLVIAHVRWGNQTFTGVTPTEAGDAFVVIDGVETPVQTHVGPLVRKAGAIHAAVSGGGLEDFRDVWAGWSTSPGASVDGYIDAGRLILPTLWSESSLTVTGTAPWGITLIAGALGYWLGEGA